MPKNPHEPDEEIDRDDETLSIDNRCKDNLSKAKRSQISRKGGLKVSKNREHMREIGRKGGLKKSSAPYTKWSNETTTQVKSHLNATNL